MTPDLLSVLRRQELVNTQGPMLEQLVKQRLETGALTKNHIPCTGVVWCAHIDGSTPIPCSQQCSQGAVPSSPTTYPKRMGKRNSLEREQNQLVLVSHCVQLIADA